MTELLIMAMRVLRRMMMVRRRYNAKRPMATYLGTAGSPLQPNSSIVPGSKMFQKSILIVGLKCSNY